MSAIATKNLEQLAEQGIQIQQEEKWTKGLDNLQKILVMDEKEKIHLILKEAYDCASILESINELRSIRASVGDFSVYCSQKIYEILGVLATDEEKKKMQDALECEKIIEARRLAYSKRERILTYNERVENQQMIDFSEGTFHELINKLTSNISDADEKITRRLYRYTKARHFASHDWTHIVQRCYNELIAFAKNAQGIDLDERAAELLTPAELNNYLIKYFRKLAELIKKRDFETAATICPYPHIKSVWMSFLRPENGETILRDVPNNDNSWMCGECLPKTKSGTYDFIFDVGGLEDADVEFDGEIFGPNKLEKILLKEFLGSHKTIMSQGDPHLRYCITTPKGITMDFIDFENVYKITQGIASGLLGRQKMYLFLGQTLGNYSAEERSLLVQRFYDNMQQGDFFLVGVDMAPDCKTAEARVLRLEQIKTEYSKGENFVRAVINSSNAQVEADYDEQTNDVVIHVENNGQRREFFRSHKFSHQEINELLDNTGFKIVGSRYYTNPRDMDFGLEYAILLCQKAE